MEKFIEVPFGAKDSELGGWEYTIPEGMEATIVDNKIVVKKKESEDDRIRKELYDFCINCSRGETIVNQREEFQRWAAWLEKQGEPFTKKDVDDAYLKGVTDTKNEIEKQYEASYQIRKDIATFIFNYRGDIKDRAKWMNYLGIKVSFVEKQGKQENICDKCKKEQPSHSCQDITALGRCAVEHEQTPAWSEEDEKEFEQLLDILHINSYESFDSWLKSLKDRYTWKPSDEQLDALAEALSLAKSCGEESAFDLRTLHEQLKKLRGGIVMSRAKAKLVIMHDLQCKQPDWVLTKRDCDMIADALAKTYGLKEPVLMRFYNYLKALGRL